MATGDRTRVDYCKCGHQLEYHTYGPARCVMGSCNCESYIYGYSRDFIDNPHQAMFGFPVVTDSAVGEDKAVFTSFDKDGFTLYNLPTPQLHFSASQIEQMQKEQKAKLERIQTLYAAGLISKEEARTNFPEWRGVTSELTTAEKQRRYEYLLNLLSSEIISGQQFQAEVERIIPGFFEPLLPKGNIKLPKTKVNAPKPRGERKLALDKDI